MNALRRTRPSPPWPPPPCCWPAAPNMSERQQGTAKGAGIGAVAGAVIGSATGGKRRHRRGDRRCDRRGRRQHVVQAHGRPPQRDGAGHARHRRRGDPHRRQPAQAEHAERHLVRHRQRRHQAAAARACSTRSRTACATTRTRALRDRRPHRQHRLATPINNPLSVERAQSVRDYLADRGVAGARASRPPAAASASRSPTTPATPAARRTAASRSTCANRRLS